MLNVKQLPSWAQSAMAFKDSLVSNDPAADLPPLVIAERGGRMVAVVVAPQVDKDLGLKAAHFLRLGTAADTLTLVCDAFFKEEEKSDRETSYVPGEFAQMAEGGAIERGEIAEALSCVRVAANGDSYLLTIPYTRQGNRVIWQQDQVHEVPHWDTSGPIPEILARILAERPSIDDPTVIVMAKKHGLADDRERQLFHTGRGVLQVLHKAGFHVLDLITGEHPEWLDDEGDAGAAQKEG